MDPTHKIELLRQSLRRFDETIEVEALIPRDVLARWGSGGDAMQSPIAQMLQQGMQQPMMQEGMQQPGMAPSNVIDFPLGQQA